MHGKSNCYSSMYTYISQPQELYISFVVYILKLVSYIVRMECEVYPCSVCRSKNKMLKEVGMTVPKM